MSGGSISSADLEAEFERLGVDTKTTGAIESGAVHQRPNWRLDKTLNADYALCSTYPRMLVVPMDSTPELAQRVAKFRTRGRLPVLCWRRDGMGALLRGSQPGAGLLNKRSTADEGWFRLLGVGGTELALLDCRPHVAAMANKFKGGGAEGRSRYEFSVYEYLGIANVHAVKAAAAKTRAGSDGPWLKLQCALLHAAARASGLLASGANVLLHCSDGWDRTPQVACLSQLLLDGHYRTRRGFALLVEKEWLAFGHKFGTRRALGMPIFVQFLDAVEQLRLQNAAAFEWNEAFLLALAAAHDGEPGAELPRMPFEADSERERAELVAQYGGAAAAPPQIWDLLMDDAQYANPAFAPGATDRLTLDFRPEALCARVRPRAVVHGGAAMQGSGSSKGPTLKAGSAKESVTWRGRSTTMQAAKEEVSRERSRTVATTSSPHRSAAPLGSLKLSSPELGDSGKGAIKVSSPERSSESNDIPSPLPPTRKPSSTPSDVERKTSAGNLLMRKRSESSNASSSSTGGMYGAPSGRKRSETPSSPRSPFSFMTGRRTDIEDDINQMGVELRSGDAMMLGVGAAARERGITMGEMI